MLRLETEMLNESTGDGGDIDFILAQARLSRVMMWATGPETASALTATEALRLLESILFYCRSIALAHSNAAAKLAADVRFTLNQPSAPTESDRGLKMLSTAFDDLASRLEPTAYSMTMHQIQLAEKALQDGMADRAEEYCKRALAADALEGVAELETRRLLLEAFVGQGKWGKAHELLDLLTSQFGQTTLHPEIIQILAHNVGLACAVAFLSAGSLEAVDLLDNVVSWPPLARTLEGRPSVRLEVLQAIMHLARNDRATARKIIRSIDPRQLNEDTEAEASGWLALWRLVRLLIGNGDH